MWPSRERFRKYSLYFFFLTTWFVSTPFPFKTHPSQLAALSIIYFGCLLENKRSCSCRWVCQTWVYFPVSGSVLFLLKPDPLKWIPGHQERTKKLAEQKGKIFVVIIKLQKKLFKNKSFTLISLEWAQFKKNPLEEQEDIFHLLNCFIFCKIDSAIKNKHSWQ